MSLIKYVNSYFWNVNVYTAFLDSQIIFGILENIHRLEVYPQKLICKLMYIANFSDGWNLSLLSSKIKI